MAAADTAAAAEDYRRALALGGDSWPGKPHTLEQLIAAFEIGDPAACAKLADSAAPSLARTRSFVIVALAGLVCATDPKSSSNADLLARLERLAIEALALAAAEEDDRYQLYDALIDARKESKDVLGVHRYAAAYLAYANSQPLSRDENLRSARDLSRLRAATALEDTSSVVSTLEESERALPSYTASLRLANAYLGAHRATDAEAAATRGLAKQPGPMGSIRLLTVRAKAELAENRAAPARQDLESAKGLLPKIADESARENLTGAIEHQLGEIPAAPR
jgi:hypothetical protein